MKTKNEGKINAVKIIQKLKQAGATFKHFQSFKNM